MSVLVRPVRGDAADWAHALDLVAQAGGPLHLAFQPIVDLARGTVAGYETLARFSVEGLPAAPLPWLEAAGRHDRLCELEQAILAKALAVRPRLPADAFLSINLSARALLDVGTSRILSAAGDLRGIVIEITEHEPVSDYDALRTALAPALRSGALLAVDDAGSGYASLGHVLALRPAFVKLDRGLVGDIDHARSRGAAVAAIGALAGELDGWIVAEGIERPEELEALVGLGVPLGQGYLLGRPTTDRMEEPPPEVVRDLRQTAARLDGPRTVRDLVDAVRTRRAAAGEPMPSVMPPVRTAAAALERGEMAAVVDAAARADAAVPVAPVGHGTATPSASLIGEVRSAPVVHVDEHGAPRWLEVDGRLRAPVRVMPHEPLVEVALRAASRPDGERVLPLVCCDERGVVLGLVHLDRMVEALARAAR